jgi:hypothetical protein
MTDFNLNDVMACGKEGFDFAEKFATDFPIGSTPLQCNCPKG